MKSIASPSYELECKQVIGILAHGRMLAAASAASAHADNHPIQGKDSHARATPPVNREWQDHATHARRYWSQPNHEDGGIVYAIPLVYAPPPQYEEPGFNLIVPVHIH